MAGKEGVEVEAFSYGRRPGVAAAESAHIFLGLLGAWWWEQDRRKQLDTSISRGFCFHRLGRQGI